MRGLRGYISQPPHARLLKTIGSVFLTHFHRAASRKPPPRPPQPPQVDTKEQVIWKVRSSTTAASRGFAICRRRWSAAGGRRQTDARRSRPSAHPRPTRELPDRAALAQPARRSASRRRSDPGCGRGTRPARVPQPACRPRPLASPSAPGPGHQGDATPRTVRVHNF
jgi:hypothetical protein